MPKVNKGSILDMAHANFPSFLRQKEWVEVLDAWTRGEQQTLDPNTSVKDTPVDGHPFAPREMNPERTDLASRAPTPWGGLIVTSLAQTLYVTGVRIGDSSDMLQVWKYWQENGWDAYQLRLHRATIAHGFAFGVAMPAKSSLTGDASVRMRAFSGKKMAAFYDEDDDEWPRFAIWAEPRVDGLGLVSGYYVRLYDEVAEHYLSCEGDGTDREKWEYISYEPHNAGVTPVVRYARQLDLDGRATGEIEPIIPMLRRIDQGTFDRLVVQRFGAWKVRYIAGLAKPSGNSEKIAQAMRLKMEDLLVSEKPDTKFGTLDATEIKGFSEANDTDLRHLAAITQTPPHHLLGLSSNLQAEALAAAEAGLQRKSFDTRTNLGESHEQFLRLVAHMTGLREEARAFNMRVRWKDTESRSLVQAANALGIMATSLKIPVEMLWEKLPDWTDDDSERAKRLVESGSIDRILAEFEAEMQAQGGTQGANGEGGSENEPARG